MPSGVQPGIKNGTRCSERVFAPAWVLTDTESRLAGAVAGPPERRKETDSTGVWEKSPQRTIRFAHSKPKRPSVHRQRPAPPDHACAPSRSGSAWSAPVPAQALASLRHQGRHDRGKERRPRVVLSPFPHHCWCDSRQRWRGRPERSELSRADPRAHVGHPIRADPASSGHHQFRYAIVPRCGVRLQRFSWSAWRSPS